MDYKAKYEEALERAKKLYKEAKENDWTSDIKDYEEIFPELAESENERMMKNIRLALLSVEDAFWRTHGLTAKEAISYLEKQKEQEIASASTIMIPSCWEEKQEKQKPIKWTDLTWKDIVELEGIINNVHYDFSAGIGQESFGKEVLERFRSTKGIEYLDEAEQKYWREAEQKEQKPAGKYYSSPDCGTTTGVWSEEDEEMIANIISSLRGYMCVISGSKNINNHEAHIQKEIEFLNALRLSWKPSEEQMRCLDMVLCDEAMDDNVHRVLVQLSEQLKKLMED